MKKAWFPMVALVVSLCLLLTGCRIPGLFGASFDDMVYTRPSLPELTNCADQCVELAQTEEDFDALWLKISEFFTLYSDFYTQYLLAYVHYCLDMRDLYWVEEYNYCEEKTPQAEALRDKLLRELAKSPLREELEGEDYFGADYFDDYDGESIWTEDFLALKEQESQLVSQYYQICQDAALEIPYTEEYYNRYGMQLEELYIEMVLLRQQLAQAAGYRTYPEYAYDQLYFRDYTVTDAADFCQQVRQELVPLYRELAETGFWDNGINGANEYQTYRYVRTAAMNMGSDVEEAFRLMAQNDLYHISYGENKLDSSFEVYFYDYEQPFVFVSPGGSELDHLSFAHEFGHFCQDYWTYGNTADIDTAEVFSQGMEYLSLFYADPSQDLIRYKLADGLSTYVEQAAYDCFERQVYSLSTDELTVETLRDLFAQIGEDFGLDCWDLDGRDYVGISHFFTQPMYVISYVVSNDAAFQLYQLEQQNRGAGLDIYLETLDAEAEGFLSYLEEAGLDSPFETGRVETVRKTLETVLMDAAD